MTKLRVFLGTLVLLSFSTAGAQPPVIQFNLLYQRNGTAVDDYFGTSVAGGGDINNDGRTDFIVGAPQVAIFTEQAVGDGYVKVYSGINGAPLMSLQSPGVDPCPLCCVWFGWSVANAGNVDINAGADFIVGSPYWDNIDGRALVYRKKTGDSIIYDLQVQDACETCTPQCRVLAAWSGWSVAGIGDVNADGKADFIVGETHKTDLATAGSAKVFSGVDGSILTTVNGTEPGAFFGSAVAGAGDIYGGGALDFIVGDWGVDAGGTDRGKVYIYSGTSPYDTLFTRNGEQDGDRFGWSVASVGDVNGDRKDDILVGAYRANPGGLNDAGKVYLYSGASGYPLIATLNGAAAADSFGYSVAGLGDVDADEVPDFVVGAPGNQTGRGKIYIYSGYDRSLLGSKVGGAPGVGFGYSVAKGGDMTGDGLSEIIAGAPYATYNSNEDAGSVYVYKPVLLAPPRIRAPLPTTFSLEQNYPNPFNANTNISFSLDAGSRVELVVYNILGEKVRTLVSEDRPAGTHQVAFDGRDAKGKTLSSGTYFYKLTAGDRVVTKQMVLVK